jgi:hypothetical protein
MATRWPSFVVPSARGWKSRDILANRGSFSAKVQKRSSGSAAQSWLIVVIDELY